MCCRKFKFNDIHVAGARAIAEASKAAGVKKFIHFSALGASHDSPSKFLRSKVTSFYHLSLSHKRQAQGEDAVRDAFPEAIIIRPAATFGAEDRYFNYYASLRVFPLGMVPVLDKGVGIYKYPVSVSDIASGVVNIINDPSISGATYEFVG